MNGPESVVRVGGGFKTMDSKSPQGLLRPPEDPETPSLPRLSLRPGGRPRYLLHSSTKVSRSSLLGFFCLS